MGITISAEAKARYIERRKKDIENCHSAIANLDYKFLQNLGHQLKGSSSTFGHQRLADLGADMEEKAKNKDMSEIKMIIKNFEDYLKTLS